MTIKHSKWPFALVALIAIVPLTGCGSEATTETGSLAVHATPQATVTIDGEARGTTPLEVQLAPGTHQITLSAEGFKTIQERVDLAKGESHKAEHFLALDSVDSDRIATVAKELGIDTEPFEAPSAHRGAGDAVFTQYWPRGKVRLDSLRSFRVDVGMRYGDDVPLATLVFKKGKKILHEIPNFDPATPITIADMPSEVVSQLKPGSSFSWGFVFDDRKHRKLSDSVTVKVLGKGEATKIEKTVNKLKEKKYFRRQDPIVQDTLVAQTLENKRLYTEALLSYINILSANPGVTSPFKGVVTTLRRLDLDKSEMFQVASQFVGGRGGRSGVDKSGGGNQAPDLSDAAPRDRSLALLAPPSSSVSGGYSAGGAVDVDPSAVAPDAIPGSVSGGTTGGTGSEANPSGVPNNNGAAPGQGEVVDPADPDKKDDPSASGPESNTGIPNVGDPDKKDDPAAGSGAATRTPIESVAQAREDTQALRQALQEAVNSGDATAAQVQALHQAVRDAEAALEQMQAAADQAEAGDENAQRAFDRAQTDHQNAQNAGNQAIPDTQPGQPAEQPVTRPTTMEEALTQMIRAGTPPPNASQLLRVLRTAREHEEAAASATQAVADTRAAEAAAEAAVRNVSPEATNEERNAAAQALADARTAREAAEAAAVGTENQAQTSRDAANQAAEAYADVARQAEALIRGN